MNLTTLSRRVSKVFPARRALKSALSGRRVALCMHRVHSGPRRSGERLPDMSISESALDALIEELVEATAGEKNAVTVSFDDGYRDAVQYISSRADQFAQVRFLAFVCPERAETRRGFRWDVAELAGRGVSFASVVEGERAIAEHPEFAVATVVECQALLRLGNVELGNHTNAHVRMAKLSMDEARAELRQSTEDFRRLFGEPRHFAYPFGTPGLDFDHRHGALLADVAPQAMAWSTHPATFERRDEAPGTVLPRFSVDGTWRLDEQLAWMAVQSTRARLFSSGR